MTAPDNAAAPGEGADAPSREAYLVDLLDHQVHRDHGHYPEGCRWCYMADAAIAARRAPPSPPPVSEPDFAAMARAVCEFVGMHTGTGRSVGTADEIESVLRAVHHANNTPHGSRDSEPTHNGGNK